ncbi:Mbeg1-like protein [Bifidobacterium sp. SO1]|uniref:Mbeg1-like protein n=1 Tax=Bifidobacterium sp. SO1 TaxID=2809029 RepID=UPI001BDC1048|nr:Mbeg1-like protein [Bifidobacterium sp. SO1]MBT1160354.1 DUF2974 domain-containing protein [Bifidobacterium sp. SO1]
MGNILDNARTNFRGFGELPFNEVDSLVLSELAYIHMPDSVPRFGAAKTVASVPLGTALRAEDYPTMFTTGSDSVNEYRLGLLRAVCESPRYRGIRVGEYAEQLDAGDQTQFAAMTFDLTDCDGVGGALLYVAFRGTDGTLIGWKEDFNMAVRCPVPAQRSAAEYLRSIADRSAGVPGAVPARLMVGGHSKGGNMAIYAAMRMVDDAANDNDTFAPKRNVAFPDHACHGVDDGARDGDDVRKSRSDADGRIVMPRIARIFSHDGPGFDAAITASPAYRAVFDRISKTVPEASVIGMLLDDGGLGRTIVKADAIGILQHMGGSWQVEDGRFVTASELTSGAQFADRTISTWLAGVDQRQREVTIDQVYDVVAAAGYTNFADLAANWTDALPKILMAATSTDRKTRELITSVLKGLPSSAMRSLVQHDAQR